MQSSSNILEIVIVINLLNRKKNRFFPIDYLFKFIMSKNRMQFKNKCRKENPTKLRWFPMKIVYFWYGLALNCLGALNLVLKSREKDVKTNLLEKRTSKIQEQNNL